MISARTNISITCSNPRLDQFAQLSARNWTNQRLLVQINFWAHPHTCSADLYGWRKDRLINMRIDRAGGYPKLNCHRFQSQELRLLDGAALHLTLQFLAHQSICSNLWSNLHSSLSARHRHRHPQTATTTMGTLTLLLESWMRRGLRVVLRQVNDHIRQLKSNREMTKKTVVLHLTCKTTASHSSPINFSSSPLDNMANYQQTFFVKFKSSFGIMKC